MGQGSNQRNIELSKLTTERRDFYGIEELAASLGATKSLVYLMERLGDLTPSIVDQKRCYTAHDIRIFFASPFGRFILERYDSKLTVN